MAFLYLCKKSPKKIMRGFCRKLVKYWKIGLIKNRFVIHCKQHEIVGEPVPFAQYIGSAHF